MRGARLAWLAIVALGCGGTAKPVEEPTKKLPDIDPDQAEHDAKGLVTEVYQALGTGNTDDLQTLLSEDLFVFGPRRGDALANREDTVVALGKVVDANNKKLVKSAVACGRRPDRVVTRRSRSTRSPRVAGRCRSSRCYRTTAISGGQRVGRRWR